MKAEITKAGAELELEDGTKVFISDDGSVQVGEHLITNAQFVHIAAVRYAMKG